MRVNDELRAEVLDDQLFNADVINLNADYNLRELITVGDAVEAWETGLIK